VAKLRELLVRAHDATFREANRRRVERAVIATALTGFLAHVAVIALVRLWDDAPSFMTAAGTSFLGAVYTPFSFILFYEVLLLVAAFAESTARQMALQYQIISLIVIRRVFKDFAQYEEPGGLAEHAQFTWTLGSDLGGSLLLVLLTAVFELVRRKAGDREEVPEGLLLDLKKGLAFVLGLVLVGLALLNLGRWSFDLYSVHILGVSSELHVDSLFYSDFFTILILADVVVLVRSWRLIPTYGALIRNAGFVISTILIRLAVTAPKPYHLVLAGLGIGFGIAIYAITHFLHRVSDQTWRHEESPEEPEDEAGDEGLDSGVRAYG